MQHQHIALNLKLPAEIPPPKFAPFQWVKKGESTLIELQGMQWIEDEDGREWWYTCDNAMFTESSLVAVDIPPSAALPPTLPVKWKERCHRHQPLLNALSKEQELVFLHAAEGDFNYLDARVAIEQRLNVPLIDLLGHPLSVVAPEIAEPRRFWLKRALETGCAQTYYYTHEWQSEVWRFRCDVAPLWGSEEVLVVTTDAAGWQRPWWDEHLKIKH